MNSNSLSIVTTLLVSQLLIFCINDYNKRPTVNKDHYFCVPMVDLYTQVPLYLYFNQNKTLIHLSHHVYFQQINHKYDENNINVIITYTSFYRGWYQVYIVKLYQNNSIKRDSTLPVIFYLMCGVLERETSCFVITKILV